MEEEKNTDKEIEKKLSDLLNIGWILLDEKCPLETCDCPLLKSFDGNKYCVKCEMWQFPDQVKVKQKYTDLVVKSSQEIALRETRLAKIYPHNINLEIYGKEAVLNSLRIKLAYLSSERLLSIRYFSFSTACHPWRSIRSFFVSPAEH